MQCIEMLTSTMEKHGALKMTLRNPKCAGYMELREEQMSGEWHVQVTQVGGKVPCLFKK